MSQLTFFRDAGQNLIPPFDPAAPDVDALAASAAAAIKTYLGTQGIDTSGLTVEFDPAGSTVTVSGEAFDTATGEKIVLCCGNVKGVAAVNDNLTVAYATDESQYYDVVSGDNLSKISQQFYGDPTKYQAIFQANKPMLSSPDKIYPGQKLRIPPLA